MWNKVLIISCLLFGTASFSQYGNEWIDYDQQYFSIKIYQNGVYKLDYATLSDAGVPVGSVSPENFQLFGFDTEQEIWLEDGGDGSFDPGDYIVFYGKKNTSWLDSTLYDDPNFVANKYYPLYNDTINYYLSWNTGFDNERITSEVDVDFGSYAAKPYFLKTSYKEGHYLYMEGYKVSGMSQSPYVEGEGWFGPRFFMAGAVNYQDDYLSTTNAYSGVGAPNTKGIAVSTGASSATYDGAGNHHLRLQYGLSNTLLYDTIFTGFQKNNLLINIATASLGASTTRIRHQLVNYLGVASDYQAVAYTELTYPHTPNLEGTTYYELTIPHNDSEAKTHYAFTSFSSLTPWAITLGPEMKRIPVVESGGIYEVLIPNGTSGQDQGMVIFDESTMIVPTEISPINGTGFFTNYSVTNFESSYLLISHQSLWSGALDYKAYRESLQGGGHNVVLVDVDELYHQFGGGVQKHVMGLRRFADYAYNQSTHKAWP